MRILMIGGTGFIGPAVVRALCRAGHDVAVFHRGVHEPALPANVVHIHGDRQQLPDFAREFREFAPDVAIDMFPMTGPAAEGVMSLFKGLVLRVVMVSSIDVYRAYDRIRGVDPGPPDPVPLTEDSPLRDRLYPFRSDEPIDPGAEPSFFDLYDKIPAERHFLGDPSLPGTVLRLPMVYGPGDRQHRLFEDLKPMIDGRPYILVQQDMAGYRAPYGFVENVGAAIALATVDSRAAGRVYNVGAAESLPRKEWIAQIGRAAGWNGDIVVLPRERMPVMSREDNLPDQQWITDTTRIRRELGFEEPVTFEAGLSLTVEWERQNPPEFDAAALQARYAAEDEAIKAVRSQN